ncbi:hypothetical protein VTJ49DRAFT_4108 [Mycothermus thermophilus]|uniref:Zn(2)-C6 fungal-type domain-containing protein n=1 Tax=Humicola insolens TaxID=85995 RepID=A0ABR3V727_HUMIN
MTLPREASVPLPLYDAQPQPQHHLPQQQQQQHQQQRQQSAGPLRRLLPATGAAMPDANPFRETPALSPSPTSSVGPSGVVSNQTAAPPRRKRAQATTAACGACRKRKSRCNGERPTCSICRDRGTVCEFDTNATETHTQALKRKYQELQSQKTAFEQVYEVLQTRSESEAVEVFRRIRNGDDASSILRHVNYGDVLVQLALVPEARYRYEFPYIPDMPPFLRQLDNPYLDSEVYDYTLRSHEAPPQAQAQGQQQQQQQQQQEPQQPQPSRRRLLPNAENGTVSVYGNGKRDPYLKPYLSATVVHPWLDSVKPSKWTNVMDDDVLMRKILHDYLLFEYDWFTYLHKDYFLEDMATEKHRFCSQLLVNAVLGAGCFCHRALPYRAEFWNPKNPGYQFLAEAKRLFELESETPRPFRNPGDPEWERKDREWENSRLCTIQAAMLLNFIQNINGSDKIGWRCTLKAIDMAHEIGLFGPQLDRYTADEQCVRTYTAWALFCWQSLSSYHYVKPPPIKAPPMNPLPDPTQQPQWYGELWVRYPLSQFRLPTYHGLLFKAKADFWVILTEFATMAFSDGRTPADLPVGQILECYNKLRAWHDSLPEPLTARKIVMPHQLKLHMHYKHVLVDLVRPILGYAGPVTPGSAQTPRDIYVEAVTHFETLLRLYYLRHGFEATDAFLLHFLGFFAHITIDAVETSAGSSFLEARRSTLLLVMKGIYDQSRAHFLAKAILRLQASHMRPEDVELLTRFVFVDLEDKDQLPISGPLEQAVLTDWPSYDVGLDARAELMRQGQGLASSLASLSLEPQGSTPSATTPSSSSSGSSNSSSIGRGTEGRWGSR